MKHLGRILVFWDGHFDLEALKKFDKASPGVLILDYLLRVVFIVYGEVRQYRLTFVHRDDDDDDDEDDDEDEVSTKKFFKFLYIRPPKHA